MCRNLKLSFEGRNVVLKGNQYLIITYIKEVNNPLRDEFKISTDLWWISKDLKGYVESNTDKLYSFKDFQYRLDNFKSTEGYQILQIDIVNKQ